MSGKLSVSFSDLVITLTDTLGIKNSGKGILIPACFDLDYSAYDNEALPFFEILESNPSLLDEIESGAKGIQIDSNEDYLNVSYRKTEYIFVSSESNYVSVYSTIKPEKDVEKITINGKKMYLLSCHDSCWRIDGVECFEKMLAKVINDDLKQCCEKLAINLNKFNKRYVRFEKNQIFELNDINC